LTSWLNPPALTTTLTRDGAQRRQPRAGGGQLVGRRAQLLLLDIDTLLDAAQALLQRGDRSLELLDLLRLAANLGLQLLSALLTGLVLMRQIGGCRPRVQRQDDHHRGDDQCAHS
jgi:hypothetical protein